MNSHCVVDFLGSRAQPQALHGVPCRVLESGDERGCALSMSSDTFAKDRTKEIDVPANEPGNIKVEAIDFMSDAVVTLDATGKISSWNGAAQSLLGYTSESMVGGSMVSVIPEEFRARHVAGFHAAMDSGTLKHAGRAGHVRATTADGRVIDLAMTLGLIKDSDGTVAGAVAVLRPLVDPEPFAL
jgi:PAS domain S-box-containing protein